MTLFGFRPPIRPLPIGTPLGADRFDPIPGNLSDPWWPWNAPALPPVPVPFTPWPFPSDWWPEDPVPGLDPGLNDPEPSPLGYPDVPPDSMPFEPDPNNPDAVADWAVDFSVTSINISRPSCVEGAGGSFGETTVYSDTLRIPSTGITVNTVQGLLDSLGCNQPENGFGPAEDEFAVTVIGAFNTVVSRLAKLSYNTLSNSYQPGRLVTYVTTIDAVRRNDEPQPLPNFLPNPDRPTKPRPLPLIPEPLVPVPEPDFPVPVPEPDTDPEPEPLEAPEPNYPDREPVIIPRPAPAEPQPVPTEPATVPLPFPFPIIPGTDPKPAPDPFPGTDPVPQPQPAPAPGPQPGPEPLPGVVPLPAPLPGIPPIRQPDPDPQPEPAPAPNPLPQPGPVPLPQPPPVPGPDPLPNPEPGPDPDPQPFPGTDPLPGESPLPQPLPLPGPIPAPIPLPGITPAPRPIDPVSGPVPLPGQYPKPTPPEHHFPLTGGPAVTPGGTRPAIPAIAAEVGRIEQKVANIPRPGGLPDVGQLAELAQLLLQLLEEDLPGTTYKLTGVCEEPVGEGEQPDFTISIPPAKNFTAITERLDVIDSLLQQHLAWKTPICGKERPELKGDFVTIHFESDQASPNGQRPLRKLFRYRTNSSRSVEQLRDYWRDFTWNAGNTCVQHTGSSWGTPQVWAASEAEGKRVIQHAAGEAGFVADQVGEWRVSGSDDPRYGMSGKMRRSMRLGDYWLTSRRGPSELPWYKADP